MNAFMFYAHHDGPPRTLPADWKSQRSFTDQPVHQGAYGFPVRAHLLYRWPVIMGSIQIIPTHLIDTNREHRLHSGIYPFRDQPCKQQLIRIKSRSMAQIENEWMAQGNGLFIVSIFSLKRLEKLLVAVQRSMEIIPDLLALCLGIVS